MYDPYNLYNPYNSYYNYGQQTQQIPQQMQRQPQQIYKPQNIVGLQGKVVDSLDVVKATDIPYDGSVSYFPLTDGTAIITKQLQQDGTSKVVIYKPISENEASTQQPKYITETELKEQLKGVNMELKEQIKDINSKDIKDIKEDIKTLKRKLEDITDDIKYKKEK